MIGLDWYSLTTVEGSIDADGGEDLVSGTSYLSTIEHQDGSTFHRAYQLITCDIGTEDIIIGFPDPRMTEYDCSDAFDDLRSFIANSSIEDLTSEECSGAHELFTSLSYPRAQEGGHDYPMNATFDLCDSLALLF